MQLPLRLQDTLSMTQPTVRNSEARVHWPSARHTEMPRGFVPRDLKAESFHLSSKKICICINQMRAQCLLYVVDIWPDSDREQAFLIHTYSFIFKVLFMNLNLFLHAKFFFF